MRSGDVDDLHARIVRENESIEEWCRREGVDPAVILRVFEVVAPFFVIPDAFRLGYLGRQLDEPKGTPSAGWAAGGPRFVVQFGVVDSADGRIVADLLPTAGEAAQLAATFEAVDERQSRGAE